MVSLPKACAQGERLKQKCAHFPVSLCVMTTGFLRILVYRLAGMKMQVNKFVGEIPHLIVHYVIDAAVEGSAFYFIISIYHIEVHEHFCIPPLS